MHYKCTCWSENTTLTQKDFEKPKLPSIEDFGSMNNWKVNAVYKIVTYIFKCEDCWYTKEVSR